MTIPAPPSPGGSTGPSTCQACGYHLTGLPTDATCPECGTPQVRRDRRYNSLDLAPSAVVRSVAVRVVTGSVLGAALVLVLLAVPFVPDGIWLWVDLLPPLLLGILMPLISWLFARGWSDPAAITHELNSGNRVLQAVRWGSVAWVSFAMMFVAAKFIGQTRVLIDFVLPGFFLSLAVVQLIGLFLVMGRLARWMRDDTGEGLVRFLVFSSCVLLFGVLAGSVIMLLYGGSRILTGFPMVIVLLILACSLFLLVKLALGAAWSVLHRYENHKYERLRAERAEEMGERTARRIERMDAEHHDRRRE